MSTPAPLRKPWVRAVLVLVAIPVLWAAELWLGVTLARFPELVFGEVASGADSWLTAALPVLIGVAVLWMIYKTPFMALSWALDSGKDKEVEASE